MFTHLKVRQKMACSNDNFIYIARGQRKLIKVIRETLNHEQEASVIAVLKLMENTPSKFCLIYSRYGCLIQNYPMNCLLEAGREYIYKYSATLL